MEPMQLTRILPPPTNDAQFESAPVWQEHVRGLAAAAPRAIALVSVILFSALLWVGCVRPEDSVRLAIIAVDRTASSAGSQSWAPEAATVAQTAVGQAISDDMTTVTIVGLGSTANDTARAATIDLTKIGGNNDAKRRKSQTLLMKQAGQVAGQLAARPTQGGTDVLAATQEASSLCRAPKVTTCSILYISDLEDSRIHQAVSVASAVQLLQPGMPSLSGITVQASGLGASGSPADVVQRTQATWMALFTQAGASNVRIARSL